MSPAAVGQILERFADAANDQTMDNLIEAARAGAMTDAHVARLATIMAESGDVLKLEDFRQTADIASTGGPSSLTTLLCPLFLRELGAVVPKLAVAGRPAGAIDVLAQIPGYQTELNATQVLSALRESGYSHCLASERLAPLDALLFARRKSTGALAVPSLVIASLLSKKVAMDARNVGLDVRVAPHGNFGSTWTDARENAKRFVHIADLLGIAARCFLSDSGAPCQPYIGRSEALFALDSYFTATEDDWLNEHVVRCFVMSKSLLRANKAALPDPAIIRRLFDQHIASQGGSPEGFDAIVGTIKLVARHSLIAESEGFLTIDLAVIRDAIVEANSGIRSDAKSVPFPDRAGVILRRKAGEYVLKGDVLAELRCDGTEIQRFAHAFNTASAGNEIFGFEEV